MSVRVFAISLLLAVGEAGAGALHLLGAAGGVVKNVAAARALLLSRLSGISTTRLSLMDVEQRRELLAVELDALHNDQKLATDIEDFFADISVERTSVRDVERMLDRISKNKVSVRNFLDGEGGQTILSRVNFNRGAVPEDGRVNALKRLFSGAEMVPVRGGEFTMGSPVGEPGRGRGDWGFDDERQVVVELSSFWMMDAPVTQRMWVEVMGENPSRFQAPGHCRNHKNINGVPLCPDLPVEGVGADSVRKFIQKLNRELGITDSERMYRLPSEAQWEYAARAGTTTAYPRGAGSMDLWKYATFIENSGGQTRPVRSTRPNLWGLYDMRGNVWELTENTYSEVLPDGRDPVHVDPKRSAYRVIRGGSFESNAQVLRPAYRFHNGPGSGNPVVGIRLVLMIP